MMGAASTTRCVTTNLGMMFACRHPSFLARARLKATLVEIKVMAGYKVLESYYLSHAVLGHLCYALGDFDQAARHFRRASEVTRANSEQAFLNGRLAECEIRSMANV